MRGWGEIVGGGEPAAGFFEVVVEVAHHEVDGAAVVVADEAPVGVLPWVEGKTGVVVVVEGAERLVAEDLEPEAFRDPLDGEVAEPLKVKLIHDWEI